MKCLLVSRDLMFSTQASSAANNAGFAAKTVANADRLADQLAIDDEYIVLLDLTMAGLDIVGTIALLKGHVPAPSKIIAVGPHVHEAKLKAASEAGCDLVLTKGQASRELSDLLAQLRTS